MGNEDPASRIELMYINATGKGPDNGCETNLPSLECMLYEFGYYQLNYSVASDALAKDDVGPCLPSPYLCTTYGGFSLYY